MSAPRAETTAEALERLIHQFADPLSFFRELIQNAIDAGTSEIDVTFAHADGVMTIEVADFGEGMDRRIIDTKLTRLFSSGKEDDYTKIGRFGIGFVSVFAIDPDAVVVDTSRGGESWRVLFGKDRTFERIALDAPVDGTTIRILKSVEPEEYEDLRRRAPGVIAYWCRHVAPEIRVDGEVINRPLKLDSPCQLRYAEEGTEVVVGYSAEKEPKNGYYNRGITLHEEPAQSCIAFKVDSRYLEHTLTRDNVLRDENYDKAMARVEELRAEALPVHLFAELERSVAEGTDARQLWRIAADQLEEWGGPRTAGWQAILPARVVPTLGGEVLSLDEASEALGDGRLYTARLASPAGLALVGQGHPVVKCRKGDSLFRFLRLLGTERPTDADAAFCSPSPVDSSPAHEQLAESVLDLLRRYGAKVSGARFGGLGYEGSPVADCVAITQRSFGELTPVEEAHELSSGLLAQRRTVVLNADHPTVRSLLRLAPRERELAAYFAVKLLFLRRELTPELDTRLANLALEERWRRLTN